MTKINKYKGHKIKLSIITVNYNVAKHVNNLVKSLNIIHNNVTEIIIIDNNSLDTKQIISTNKTRIIQNNINLGFAKAVNQGIKISKSKYILLINPDCYLTDKSIIHSLKLISKNKKIGAVGGKIKKHCSEKYQMSANTKATFLTAIFEFTNIKKLFPNNYFSKKFWVETDTITKPIKVESVCGAFTIIRRTINNKPNLFDQRFFLYMEDIDFGNKINSLGYDVIFDPKSQITHIGGESSNSKYHIVLNEWNKSRTKYFSKHLNKFESTILKIIFSIENLILYLFHIIKIISYA